MSDQTETHGSDDQMPVYDCDHLPQDGMVPGAGEWGEFVLVEPLRAIEIAGAFQCRLPLEHALRDTLGVLTYPAGGWVAIDENGDPFGIHSEQFLSIYRPTEPAETAKLSDVLSEEEIAGVVEARFGSWLTRDDISALRAFVQDPNAAAKSQLNALGTFDKLTSITEKS